MNLIEKYDLDVKNKYIKDDSAQRNILAYLDKITQQLEKPETWVTKLLQRNIKGLYVMGPVGVGKTYLMDLFFDNLDIKEKARFHFHYFMQQIDKKLRQFQGKSDPVIAVVKHLSKTTKVICLDEFLVNDVAFAMIFAQLIKEIFKRKMILVVTTNTEVDRLYEDGVGREKFLPAIDLLKKNCNIVRIQGKQDYRVNRGDEVQTYLYPLNKKTTQALVASFNQVTTKCTENSEIEILNRKIKYYKLAKNVIWFDFETLCDVPRCQLDYLEIANQFDTVFISDIPVLTKHKTTQTLLFMHFIDVAYDRGMRLFISAAASVEELYTEGELMVPFTRIVSRLKEIQSLDYQRRHQYLGQQLEIE